MTGSDSGNRWQDNEEVIFKSTQLDCQIFSVGCLRVSSEVTALTFFWTRYGYFADAGSFFEPQFIWVHLKISSSHASSLGDR